MERPAPAVLAVMVPRWRRAGAARLASPAGATPGAGAALNPFPPPTTLSEAREVVVATRTGESLSRSSISPPPTRTSIVATKAPAGHHARPPADVTCWAATRARTRAT